MADYESLDGPVAIGASGDLLPGVNTAREKQRVSPLYVALGIMGALLLTTTVAMSVRKSSSSSSPMDASTAADKNVHAADAALNAAGGSAGRPIDAGELKEGRRPDSLCEQRLYSHLTLKTAHEIPVVALLGKDDVDGRHATFEASCILKVGDFVYTVDDDTPAIGKMHYSLQYSHQLNTLLQPDSTRAAEDTDEGGFEAIFYDKDSGLFGAVVEAVALDKAAEGAVQKYHSVVHELRFNNDNTYTTMNECPCDYEFMAANKGFEGAAFVKDPSDGTNYLLGLCEGNFCVGGRHGRTPGNGRVIVLKRATNVVLAGKTWPCAWQTQRVINLPKSADFVDYSAIALHSSGTKVAVASQESAKVWIGGFNPSTFELIDEGHRVMNFPRDGDCNVVYCNIEGLDWLNSNMLVAASDQMKDWGRQSYRCLAKDQSIHVFVVPDPPLCNPGPCP
jgi:hypothetical protein